MQRWTPGMPNPVFDRADKLARNPRLRRRPGSVPSLDDRFLSRQPPMPTPDAANPSAAAPATPSAGAPLSEADVRHVARLARLAIPEGEIHGYAEQLQGILAYVAKIGEVNIEGVEPTAHAIQIRNVLREDVVGPMLSVEEVLQNASESDPPFFKVPKVIGGDEDSAG